MKKILSYMMLVLLLGVMISNITVGQVTSSSMKGFVIDKNKQSVVGATVVATHTPSGSTYGSVTQSDGGYMIPGMRIGGPYKVVVKFVGYKDQEYNDIYLSLGTSTNIDVTLQEDVVNLEDVVVTANRNDIFSSDRTGATSQFNSNQINTIPTLGRTINDVTKYNAYGRTFAGQDSRMNNYTIDGATFNGGFGLGSTALAGSRTGTTAISLDALEEIQINIAPFDVRQSGFAGAGINAVTRSGTNEFKGSVFGYMKNQDMLGTKAGDQDVTVKKFDEKTMGFSLGGPIVKNKLFFFGNYENIRRSSPALDYVASRPGLTGNVSRTTATDLDRLSNFMRDSLNYNTGSYENFNNEVKSDKFLIRLDYNINQKHKLSVRYAHHNSESGSLISNSNSAGNGNRTNLSTALAYENSGYIIMDNTRSIVGDLSSVFGSKASNNLIVTYNKQNEDRKYKTDMFPTIDILSAGSTYTSVGFDPFTPSNLLNYSTFNITDNFTYYMGKHTITAGFNYEYFKSNNLFYPASNGVWVYNSLNDFYTAAKAFIADPNLAKSPVTINKFQYRYSLLPNNEDPMQVLKVYRWALYAQDEYEPMRNLKLTLGVRIDNISFGNTGLENTIVSKMKFLNTDKDSITVNTAKLPNAKILPSPRFGFNFDVFGNKKTQIRGGVGIFTSSLPYVWISNQVGNNGILTGFMQYTNTTAYPFTTNPSKYRPATTDLNASSITFDINATDPDFKFPQILKTNIAVDQKLPFNLVATGEFMYNKSLSAIMYYQANLKTSTKNFTGVDSRPRYAASAVGGSTAANSISTKLTNCIMLANTDKPWSYSATVKLERLVSEGIGGMVAYTYGLARDLGSPGSTASSSYNSVYSVNGNNYPDLDYSSQDLRHRLVGFVNYQKSYGKGSIGGRSMVSIGMVSNSGGKISYTYSGDMNGDGVTGNDLIFVPNKASDLKFADLVVGTGTAAVTYTAAQQQEALDKFIDGNDYLSSRRGQYAERNGGYYPWLTRFDLSFEQDVVFKVGNKKNVLRFRVDIFNFGNMINKSWGVGDKITTYNPLASQTIKATDTEPVYKISTQTVSGSPILLRDSFTKSNTTDDVWQMQVGIRYIFN